MSKRINKKYNLQYTKRNIQYFANYYEPRAYFIINVQKKKKTSKQNRITERRYYQTFGMVTYHIDPRLTRSRGQLDPQCVN